MGVSEGRMGKIQLACPGASSCSHNMPHAHVEHVIALSQHEHTPLPHLNLRIHGQYMHVFGAKGNA